MRIQRIFRCIQLWEPSKHDANPKSVESWLAFMSKLRYSVLAAVDRNLKKIDEKVRNTRDRRTERSWDFINYFLCHVRNLNQLPSLNFYYWNRIWGACFWYISYTTWSISSLDFLYFLKQKLAYLKSTPIFSKVIKIDQIVKLLTFMPESFLGVLR